MHYSESPFSKYRIHLLLVSALILLSHNFWPQRVISLLPDSVKMKLVDVDSKPEVGGSSQHRWIDEKNNTWECDIGDKAPYPYCAVVFIWSNALPLTKLDLSGLDSLDLVVDYEGDASRLKIFLRDYYPLIGSAEFKKNPVFEEAIYNTQFNQVYVKVEQSEQKLRIPLSDFKVADWWVSDNHLPFTALNSSLAQVVSLGIDMPHPIPLGKHRFTIKELNFSGAYIQKDDLNSVMIIFWAIVVLAEIIVSHRKMKGLVEINRKQVLQLSDENIQIRKKAERDPLTTLYNRQGLKLTIQQLYGNDLLAQYTVLVVDIDHFKQVNDTHGHTVGDQVLVQLAEVIRCNLREQDYAARWGGEEFVLLIRSDLGGRLDSFVDRLRTRIVSNHFHALSMSNRLPITVSIGGAHIGDNGSFEATFEKADRALYQAKNSGRNKYVVSQGAVTELALQGSNVDPYTV